MKTKRGEDFASADYANSANSVNFVTRGGFPETLLGELFAKLELLFADF